LTSPGEHGTRWTSFAAVATGPRAAASGAARPEPAAVTGVRWPELNWPLVICAYFALQVLLRRFAAGSLTLDEAEMLLWSRHLAWGYGSQPPLYSWLQWLSFQIVPDTLLSLALLKNLLLAAIYLAVYRLLRSEYPARIAGPAALTLFLLPQISWESQRDLTHSVLVVTLAAGTTLAFWTCTLAGRRGGWLLFGLLTGLGLLSKVNFALVPVSLVLAAASLSDLRSRLRPAGLAIALVAAAAVVAMPTWWAFAHPEIAFSSVAKLNLSDSRGGAILSGMASLAEGVASLLGLAAVILGVIFALGRRRVDRPLSGLRPEPAAPLTRLLFRTIIAGVVLVAIGIALGGMADFRDRWLTPVVYLAAPLAAVSLIGATGAWGARALVRTIAVLAAVVIVVLTVHFRYGKPGKPSLTGAPVAAIVADLTSRHPGAGRIVAEPAWLAGNLVLVRPDLPIVSATVPGAPPAAGEEVVALWWNGDRSQRIIETLGQRWNTGIALTPSEPFSAPFPMQPGVALEIGTAVVARGVAP
jgi:4-amino-4-deoxy-L-arabinose transferase-like glycosyltransferase